MDSNYDLVGIGIGPSNLSLAALLTPVSNITSIFFDRKSTFSWHQGMLLPGSELQVHYLKDLVTLIDPTNPFSFLSFLAAKRRLYQFINANFSRVSRTEFNQYYQWVARSLPNLKFDNSVYEIELRNQSLLIHCEKNKITAKNIVLGCGLAKYVPPCAKDKLGETLIHSSDFMYMPHKIKNKRVVVIGGGQSGAEIVLYSLCRESDRPRNISWISRRDNFLPIDDSPFTNELFTPTYSNHFYDYPLEKRQKLIAKQKLFSDGISLNTLEALYQKIYALRFTEGNSTRCNLLPSFELIALTKNDDQWIVQIKETDGIKEMNLQADIVILCTGYQYKIPRFLQAIEHRINTDSQKQLIVNKDYSLSWDGPEDCKLYIQNGALINRGVPDPNLSLSAWRSAVIINSLLNKPFYDLQDNNFFDWEISTLQHENIYHV